MAGWKMEKLKVFMSRFFGLRGLLLFFFTFFCHPLLAKDISLEVVGKAQEVSAEWSEDQVLLLNGFRQAVTRELEEAKLDSALYWSKLEKKKLSAKDEFEFLKNFFSKESVARAAGADPKIPLPANGPLSGTFSAWLDLEKLKSNYEEMINDLSDTKLKTFYILASIEIDKGMKWEDVGVSKAENFSGVILESWKKLAEKEFSGFERIVVLNKDFSQKPDYMNSKSITLKWKSILKKVSSNTESQSASYELSAQYILQNTKSGTVLLAFDFPEQKRSLGMNNKKVLSSSLASLIHNLLLSQTAKIQGLIEADARNLEMTELEIKFSTKPGLSEIYQVNNLLQDKLSDLKLSAQMKTYSTEGASILIRAQGSSALILDRLSKEGGKFPLNEQKVLLFNRADKTFAILPKETNN